MMKKIIVKRIIVVGIVLVLCTAQCVTYMCCMIFDRMDELGSASLLALPIAAIIILLLMTVAQPVASLCVDLIVGKLERSSENIDDFADNPPFEEMGAVSVNISRQQRRRQENDRMRKEFTANVSHELKTPLTSISGYAEMIQNGMARDEDVRDFAGKIHAEAGRLIALIGDIIKLSELDAPQEEKTFEKVDLLEIAGSAAQMLSFSAERLEVSVEVEGESVFVNGNRVMLDELVYNLCDNAIRYNRPKGHVRITTGMRGERPFVSVRDDGIGIPREHLARIFERFYRVDKSRSKETGGTGLGLAIVKHVAIQHDAEIEVNSAPHEGTVINVVFPEISSGGEGA